MRHIPVISLCSQPHKITMTSPFYPSLSTCPALLSKLVLSTWPAPSLSLLTWPAPFIPACPPGQRCYPSLTLYPILSIWPASFFPAFPSGQPSLSQPVHLASLLYHSMSIWPAFFISTCPPSQPSLSQPVLPYFLLNDTSHDSDTSGQCPVGNQNNHNSLDY